ncbi:MAG: ketopantoate reductase family protein [Candidatus Hodarchaeota archaeon]
MVQNKIKIGFIGAGAIGSLFGGYLAEVESTEVIFFCRKEHANMVNLEGLKINQKGFIRIIQNIKAFKNLDDYLFSLKKKKSVFDYLFLTTKTYDIEKAMSMYKKIIDDARWLIILQNGIGNEEVVKKLFKRDNLIRIITSHGASLEKPGYVCHIGFGFTYIGAPFLGHKQIYEEETKSDINLIVNLIKLSGIEILLVHNIIAKSWGKAFVNIGINALGTLTRLKNGQLLEFEALKKLMSKVVKEALKVAELINIDLDKKDYIELTYQVAKETYNNKNSMLQDILKGRKTEIDFLNGRIVKYAKELGIEVPINEILTILIKSLEGSY